MHELIMDEKSWAEHMLNGYWLGNKPSETLWRLGRYFYSVGMTQAEIAENLRGFLRRCDPTIKVGQWEELIRSIAAKSQKYPLICVRGISITEDEMDEIARLDGWMMRRVMFTLLCLAKYHNAINPDNNSWVNQDPKTIFSLANVQVTVKRQSLMINDLWHMEYISYGKRVDNVNLRVNIERNDSPTEMYITDMRDLGYQYMAHFGKKFIYCRVCGRMTKQKSNGQKFCPACSNEMKKNRRILYSQASA